MHMPGIIYQKLLNAKSAAEYLVISRALLYQLATNVLPYAK
jgi:hypothetical protein